MTKKLGFGCMRLPLLNAEDPASIDVAQMCEMVDMFLARGFTYFDTAYMYHKNESERAVKKALVERHPRDSYTLATKLPLSMVSTHADFMPKFEEQLEKTGVEYFDYYLLHNVNSSRVALIEDEDPFGFALGLKSDGRIRKFGFSYHDRPELLDRLLTEHPEVDFVQLQLNYLDWESDTIQSHANYEVCSAHGKPVVVMEPVKGGLLASLPPAAAEPLARLDPVASAPQWAIRFAASLPNVFMVLSGMSSLAQMDENTSFMDHFRLLTDGEIAAIAEAAKVLEADTAIACTGCSYCTETCPKQIPIPKYFSLYNKKKSFGARSNSGLYYRNQVNMGRSPASACVACGACAKLCPQHLQIPTLMKDVAAEFEAN